MLCSLPISLYLFESLPLAAQYLFNSILPLSFLTLFCHSFGWPGANACFVVHCIPRACGREANPFHLVPQKGDLLLCCPLFFRFPRILKFCHKIDWNINVWIRILHSNYLTHIDVCIILQISNWLIICRLIFIFVIFLSWIFTCHWDGPI